MPRGPFSPSMRVERRSGDEKQRARPMTAKTIVSSGAAGLRLRAARFRAEKRALLLLQKGVTFA
jgi:hypothetical protein